MFKNWLRGACAAAMIVGFAGSAGAVGLAGNYHETNGIIINIPQNQPLADCDAAGDNARCHFKRQAFFFGAVSSFMTSAPYIGVPGAISTGGDPRAIGASFTLPPLFMNQTKTQDAPVLNNVAIYLQTSFMAAGPTTDRGDLNAETRQFEVRAFSPADTVAHGQNNGNPGADYLYRQAINTTVMDFFNADLKTPTYSIATSPLATSGTARERVSVSYSGGNGFSGTAGLLLDGDGELYIGGPNIDAFGTANQAPIIGRNPLGDGIASNFAVRNGVGWGWTIMGGQMAGTLKTFGLDPHNPLPAGFCTTTAAPALPVGCNVVVGFDTNGGPGPFPLPAATSQKFVFAWTTGEVEIVHNATRMNGVDTIFQTVTLRGDGHDALSGSGTSLVRNVGLVAGSYTKRIDGFGGRQINAQLSGMNLRFTPEPASAAALLAGIGLLGTMAVRRRR